MYYNNSNSSTLKSQLVIWTRGQIIIVVDVVAGSFLLMFDGVVAPCHTVGWATGTAHYMCENTAANKQLERGRHTAQKGNQCDCHWNQYGPFWIILVHFQQTMVAPHQTVGWALTAACQQSVREALSSPYNWLVRSYHVAQPRWPPLLNSTCAFFTQAECLVFLWFSTRSS